MSLVCGCGTSRNGSQNQGLIAGNWQFTLTAPADASFSGGTQVTCGAASEPCPILLGGFLVQNSDSVTGGLTYSIAATNQGNAAFPCSGSGPVNGTLNGQNVNLTLQAGPQTLSLNGTVSGDGKTMMGTYSSINTQACGTAQSGLQWSAVSVPPLSGSVQGTLHSVATHAQFNANFPFDQAFPISGVLTQGPNTGASNATVTGTLSFQGGYPCLGTVASVNGQISGSSIILQVIAGNGLDVGQIGTPLSSAKPGQAPAPVAIQSSPNGLVLAGINGYVVTSKKCPGSPGDSGNICLAFGNSIACAQPVTISPASLTFPPQLVGSTTSQTITLTNTGTSGAVVSGLKLDFIPQSGLPNLFNTASDFNGVPNFTERDNCAPSLRTPFTLAAGQSCSATISYSPQQSCPWLPYGNPPSSAGAPPVGCPLPSTGKLIMTMPGVTLGDSDTNFAVPIQGTGLSAITVFPAELDFGAEAPSERSPAQSVTFTNQGASPIQILPSSSAACGGPNQAFTLPRPLTPGTVSGLQVVQGGSGFTPITAASNPANTVTYICDLDPVSKQPNFQMSNDSCSGRTLMPQQRCSVDITFAPQPGTSLTAGLDFFLELNTLQCTSTTTTDCEVDAGRFPVEVKAGLSSPLRMTPAAGLDFPTQSVGQTSAPLTITLFNDPKDPNAGVVNFTGTRVQGDYFESDNCGTSLAPGSSCTLSITFTPQSVGFDFGNIVIGYTLGNIAALPQTIYLRGMGQ